MTVKTLTATYLPGYRFWCLACALLVLVALYVYFVNLIVMGVVARQGLQDKLATLESSVTDLETQYVKLSGTVTLESAYALGFKDAGDSSSFAYLARPGVTLSYRNH